MKLTNTKKWRNTESTAIDISFGSNSIKEFSYMLNSINIKDFMSVNPLTLTPATHIMDAIHEMLVRKVTGGTVLDDQGRVVGIISEIDLLDKLEQIAYYQEGDACIGDLMCSEVDVLPADITLFEAARILIKHKRRRMPVVEDGRFVGQISCRSILQAFKDSMLAHDKKED
ncbi:MAG: CBS domain-containing protein [Candidatus Paceibacteria bacterium]|mgnify:CR=1 FL=1|jgi:CBS domain-containing protein|tara:strand:+ start:531 stop:1043 length:513 start_codon:yes stop_codon:yes gene_type:complete